MAHDGSGEGRPEGDSGRADMMMTGTNEAATTTRDVRDGERHRCRNPRCRSKMRTYITFGDIEGKLATLRVECKQKGIVSLPADQIRAGDQS
jgi:hypothetical protein